MPDFLDAPGHTNNTGELSGLYYALERAGRRQPRRGREEIMSDSLYALNMTTGRWMPSKKGQRNADMIARLRRAWRRVQRLRPNEVRLCHVRSHIKVPGNELADRLADLGKDHGGMSVRKAATWLDEWLRRHSSP